MYFIIDVSIIYLPRQRAMAYIINISILKPSRRLTRGVLFTAAGDIVATAACRRYGIDIARRQIRWP